KQYARCHVSSGILRAGAPSARRAGFMLGNPSFWLFPSRFSRGQPVSDVPVVVPNQPAHFSEFWTLRRNLHPWSVRGLTPISSATQFSSRNAMYAAYLGITLEDWLKRVAFSGFSSGGVFLAIPVRCSHN